MPLRLQREKGIYGGQARADQQHVPLPVEIRERTRHPG
jgi:hypothetical protein